MESVYKASLLFKQEALETILEQFSAVKLRIRDAAVVTLGLCTRETANTDFIKSWGSDITLLLLVESSRNGVGPVSVEHLSLMLLVHIA